MSVWDWYYGVAVTLDSSNVLSVTSAPVVEKDVDFWIYELEYWRYPEGWGEEGYEFSEEDDPNFLFSSFYLDNEPKALITHLTMKAVEEMLPKDKFLRIHRSYIVHVDKIKKVDRNDCVYIGNEIIHIPEGYLPAFKSFLETHSF